MSDRLNEKKAKPLKQNCVKRSFRRVQMARDKLLTAQGVANQLSVHIDTVRQWIRNKDLEAIDLGGRAGYRVSETALDRFIRERLNTTQP